MNRAVNLVPIPMFSPEIVYEVWRCPTDLKNIGLFTRAREWLDGRFMDNSRTRKALATIQDSNGWQITPGESLKPLRGGGQLSKKYSVHHNL